MSAGLEMIVEDFHKSSLSGISSSNLVTQKPLKLISKDEIPMQVPNFGIAESPIGFSESIPKPISSSTAPNNVNQTSLPTNP